MAAELERLSAAAREAVAARDWPRVGSLAIEIRRLDPESSEGAFLLGLAQKAAQRHETAAGYFAEALEFDAGRYDAAIELASLLAKMNRQARARALLDEYAASLESSPLYLDMAGSAYAAMSLYEDAWAMHAKANALQPDATSILANLASCAVYLGKIDEARAAYRTLIRQHPANQRNHYELAQLASARDERHIRQMQKILKKNDLAPHKNIFLYYALGKEYEDLGRWDDAFRYFKKAGDAVKSVAPYRVEEDTSLIDAIIDVCTGDWLADSPCAESTRKTPIFVVGLPRTGTTLTDRILSSHSAVQSAGETQLLQMVLRDGETAGNVIGITPGMIANAARREPCSIARAYVDAISFRLGAEPYFTEKLPENVLYLGFIARSWPDARIVHLRRHPMDACFAMYKQSYFRFAYSLEDLAAYYLAYDRLCRHWQEVLGPRMIELAYEDLVGDFEAQVRALLGRLELPFEEACLEFERKPGAVATASSVQVREKAHTRSVGRWKKFARHLEPLRRALEAGGVTV